MGVLPLTPSQTVGPYLSLGLRWEDGSFAAGPTDAGALWLRGRVLDGAGAVVLDALVETWQADGRGQFAHPDAPAAGPVSAFRGFGRSETRGGEYAICTVKPGAVAAVDGLPQAPHIDVSVFARGLLDRVVTRVYFADEARANARDPVLGALPAERRRTLVAEATVDGYRLDIVLQGPDETVFFAV